METTEGKIRWRSRTMVHDLDADAIPQAVRDLAAACIEQQKVATARCKRPFRAEPEALSKVSEAALQDVLVAGDDIHGIATDRSISNVVPFNSGKYEDAVRDEVVMVQRKALDQAMAALLRELFDAPGKLYFTESGHFWYPHQSFMSWHTNSRVPGWRAYLSYGEDPGESFFRYRDPDSAQSVTLKDSGWNLRVFMLSANRPLWHAVYSNTNRFSFGYLVTSRSLVDRVRGRLRIGARA